MKMVIFIVLVNINIVQAIKRNKVMHVLDYFSKNICYELNKVLDEKSLAELEEIRIRINKNIILRFTSEEIILNYTVTTQDILETLEKITENSRYSYEKQLVQGFITLKEGHRVGITGNAINEEEKIINISYISGMNFRISKQIKGCSNRIIKELYDEGELKNTLLVGAPGSGKTTLLRDLIRQVSNGNRFGKGLNVGVVDERNEIGTMYKGIEQNDLGLRTDTLSGVTKRIGAKMIIRSMGPEVLAVDEIGNKDDCEILEYAMCSGVKILGTAHGNSISDVENNFEISKLFKLHIIDRIIILDKENKQKIREIFYLDNIKKEYVKKCILF